MTNNKSLRLLVTGAVIAALYVVFTVLAFGFDLASGFIQVRFSEALCILPMFTPAAVPGLFVGCLIANLVTGALIQDIIFGSLATLAAALLTRFIAVRLKDKGRLALILGPSPAVIINALVVGALLMWVYLPAGLLGDIELTYPLAALSVAAGQTVACYGLGVPLSLAIEKTGLNKMIAS